MGAGSFLYKTVLFLHIFCAIAGFGSVFFAGIYGAQAAKRKGREGLAITEAVDLVGEKVATPFIYGVFVLGIVLVLISEKTWSFETLWVALSIGLFVVAIGISHGLHRPNLKKMLALTRELAEMGPPPDSGDGGPPSGSGPPQAVELAARGKKAALYGSILNLLVLVLLVLMVWKPGQAG